MGIVFGKINEEMPAHVVVHKGTDYQIWRFPSQVSATVHAKDLPRDENGQILSDDQFTRKAFFMLAGYIGVLKAPENKKRDTTNEETNEKIAMTAPVIVSESKRTEESETIAMTAPVVMSDNNNENENVGQTMTFLLPSKYKTIEDAPIPMNDTVKIGMVEQGRCEAVLAYSGNISMKTAQIKAKELTEMLKRDGVSIIGDWTLQGYNPPFTLPWLKRNEIHIPVDPEPYKDI